MLATCAETSPRTGSFSPVAVERAPAAPPPAPIEPARGRLQTYASADPGATHYVSPALKPDRRVLAGLDRFQRSLVEAVGRAASRNRRTPPVADERLSKLAIDVAREARRMRPPPLDAQKFLAGHHGLTEHEWTLFLLTGPAGDEAGAARACEQRLATVFQKGAWNRVGVAARRTGSDVLIVFVLADQQIELDPLPRRLPARGATTLAGRLLGDHREPVVVVTLPGGFVRRVPLKTEEGRAFAADLQCNHGDGRYQIEIMATDEAGPQVLANFPLYCGVSLPTSVEALDDEEGIHQDPSAAEEEMFSLVNQERREAGLALLQWDDRLAAIARAHSRDMMENDFVAHVSPSTGDAPARLRRAALPHSVVGENVGLAESARQAHKGFMASPGHRANVLNVKVSRGAIGVVLGKAENGPPPLYITQLFMAPPEPAKPAPAPPAPAKPSGGRK